MAKVGVASSRDPEHQPFPVFAFIWAISTLIHQLAFSFWVETWHGWLVTFAAFLVIWEPRCLARFATLLVTSLIHLYTKLPFVPNHILFEGMMNLTLLFGIGWATWQQRSTLPEIQAIAKQELRKFMPFLIAVAVKIIAIALPGHNHILGGLTSIALLWTLGHAFKRPPVKLFNERFYSETAPVLRLEILVMYCWAAVQKMNWDYVDPEFSCATKLHMEIMQYFPFLPNPEWLQESVSWASIVIELAIPTLLFIPRTRFAGFILTIAFHLWLSIHHAAGIFSFSALIMAMLIFFLPMESFSRLQFIWNRELNRVGQDAYKRGVARARIALVVLFLATVLTQSALYLTQGRTYDTFWTANRVGFWVWLLWGVWLAAHYLLAMWDTRFKSREFLNHLVKTPILLMLIPVILNGINPWIGLKTQTSFSMYSNLRGEGEGNHMFLRRVDLFPFQEDMIKLEKSEPDLMDPGNRPKGIQQFANFGTIMPYFELRRMVSEWEGDLTVTYERDGQILTASRVGDTITGDPKLFETIPWYLYKTQWFRRHNSLTEPMECTH